MKFRKCFPFFSKIKILPRLREKWLRDFYKFSASSDSDNSENVTINGKVIARVPRCVCVWNFIFHGFTFFNVFFRLSTVLTRQMIDEWSWEFEANKNEENSLNRKGWWELDLGGKLLVQISDIIHFLFKVYNF